MKHGITAPLIRISKFLHYLLTLGIFCVYCTSCVSHADRTQLITALLIYAVLFLFSIRTYSAYKIGMSRVHMLIYSQTLCNLIPAVLVYLVQILNAARLLTPLPLLAMLAVQFVLNCLWSYLIDKLYFLINKTKRTVIVYHSTDDLLRLEEINKHDKIFHLEKTIPYCGEDIHTLLSQLEGAEAVFVSGVDASVRNGITKYCVDEGILCYICPRVGDVLLMGAEHQELFSVPVFQIMRAVPQLEYMLIKRTIDIICSLAGIILLSPFMLITALAIKLYDHGPAIYKQIRLTKDGKEFKILKFRSMRVDAERDGIARLSTENDDRITPVGKIIRAIRFDELPQLFNILKGDMTIVGPRPERPEIARQYEQQIPAFGLRLQVKAGLTGLAQVYGKYNTDPYDKLRMDLMYINRMSLLYDIQLMMATVKILFVKDSTSGIAEGQTTAAKEDTKEYAMK